MGGKGGGDGGGREGEGRSGDMPETALMYMYIIHLSPCVIITIPSARQCLCC